MSRSAIVQASIWIAVVLIAFRFPKLGDSFFSKAEKIAAAFAAKKGLCCLSLALLVMGIRAALLPLSEIPKPFMPDEYGYLLQSDTFASGRLTNPPHPLWEFFETPYILQRPTYNSKYPPGQGLMMAIGQLSLGDPWFGVWLSCSLLAGALCWALQQWFPPGWALFGSIIALPLCISSAWMESYWGGSVAGIGGALVLGAIPRLKGTRAAVYGVIFAAGATILIYTRPFEGLMLLIPVLVHLIVQKIDRNAVTAIVAVGALGAIWLGYYNYRVTGNPALLPYTEYDRQYPSTSHFNIFPLPAPSEFRHANFRWIDKWERDQWFAARKFSLISERTSKAYKILRMFLRSTFLAIPIAVFWPVLARNRRLRVLKWIFGGALVTLCIEAVYLEHYAAPFLTAFLIFVVQAFRHLRLWEYASMPSGRWLCRGALLAMLGIYCGQESVRIALHRPLNQNADNMRHRALEEWLEERGGLHLVIVRYTKFLDQLQGDWIYNRADIDNSSVIWAQDLGLEKNQRLLDYFKDRYVWLFEPDEEAKLLPYGTPRFP